MIFKGFQSIIDAVQQGITARVPNALPQSGFAYDFPIMDDYLVPDIFTIYTHNPVTLAANALSSNEQVTTRSTEFILEHEVSNASIVTTSYGQLKCVRQYGSPGKALVDLQSTGVDAKLWLPRFATSAAIDEEYLIMPRQILGYQYANQTGSPIANIQSAFIGRHNHERLHEPYLSDGPPYMYSTREITIPANSTAPMLNITIDASKDFLLRALVAAGLQGEGALLPGSILMQVTNHSTGIVWVPNANTGATAVLLENIAYLGMDEFHDFPMGFQPFVLGHNTQYDIILQNITNAPITLTLNFWGNHCYYERTSFNKDIQFSANGRYFLD